MAHTEKEVQTAVTAVDTARGDIASRRRFFGKAATAAVAAPLAVRESRRTDASPRPPTGAP